VKILVTGGYGFIGSNFIRYFLSRHPEHQLINLDKLTYAGNPHNLEDIPEGEAYRFVKGDIADAAVLSEIFGDGIDAVIHFAAESHVDRSIEDAAVFVRGLCPDERHGDLPASGILTPVQGDPIPSHLH